MLRRILFSSLAALVLAAPAGAGTIVGKVTLVSGKLAVKSAPVTATATSSTQVTVKVADGRGNGQGWTLKVASGRRVTVTAITAHCAAGSTCTLPSAAESPSGSTVLHAAPGTGMGVVELDVTLAPLPSGSAPTALAFTAS